MKKIQLLSFILFLITFVSQAQIRLGDAVFPYNNPKNETLALNGVGMRKVMFHNTYAGALYTKNKMSNPDRIMEANEDMSIRLNILSDKVKTKSMISIFEKGFEHATDGNVAPLKNRIGKLMILFSSPVQKNDFFDFVYNEDQSNVSIYKNGESLGEIEGLDFKHALFKIWLGDQPACKYIKAGMLGT